MKINNKLVSRDTNNSKADVERLTKAILAFNKKAHPFYVAVLMSAYTFLLLCFLSLGICDGLIMDIFVKTLIMGCWGLIGVFYFYAVLVRKKYLKRSDLGLAIATVLTLSSGMFLAHLIFGG